MFIMHFDSKVPTGNCIGMRTYTCLGESCPTKYPDLVLFQWLEFVLLLFCNLSYEYSKVGICPTPILEFVLRIFKGWNLSYSYFGICPTNIQRLEFVLLLFWNLSYEYSMVGICPTISYLRFLPEFRCILVINKPERLFLINTRSPMIRA